MPPAILVIDEQPLIRDALCIALAPLGAVHVEATIDDAERWLDHGGAPHAILVDPLRPDARGIGMLHRLRAARPDVPLIVFSGRADEATADTWLAAGADGVVPRNADAVMLAASLRRLAGLVPHAPRPAEAPAALDATTGSAIEPDDLGASVSSAIAPNPSSGIPVGMVRAQSAADAQIDLDARSTGRAELGRVVASPAWIGDNPRFSSPSAASSRGPDAAQPPAGASRVDPRSLGLTDRQIDVLELILRGLPNKLICRELSLAEGTVKVHVSAVLRALGARNRTQAVIAATRLGVRSRE